MGCVMATPRTKEMLAQKDSSVVPRSLLVMACSKGNVIPQQHVKLVLMLVDSLATRLRETLRPKRLSGPTFLGTVKTYRRRKAFEMLGVFRVRQLCLFGRYAPLAVGTVVRCTW